MSKRMEAFGILSIELMTLSACGGSGAAGGGTNTPGSGTPYAFVAPAINSSRVYDETIVDNSNNTIMVSYTVTVLAIAADGTITEQQQNDSGTGNTVNGTDYAVLTGTHTYNAFGRQTAFTYTESDGNPGSCSYAPYAGGPTPPLTVGQSWQIDYTEACNSNAPIEYSQQGNVVDVESVTVPGGTFTALKLQSTITWTQESGAMVTQSSTNWTDTATFHSVKQSSTYVYSGTPLTNGYAVSRVIVLESTS